MKVDSLRDLLAETPDLSLYSYISLDFFNTVAMRRLSELEIRRKSWQAFSTVTGEVLTDFDRFEAMRSVMIGELGRPSKDYSSEISLDFSLLYRKVFERLSMSDPEDAADHYCRILIDFEIDNLSINGELQAFIRTFRQQGVSFLLLSDTGYNRAAITVILAGLGILDLFDEVFVSCQGLGSKFSGDLYLGVIRLLGIETSRLLHIGDNPVSDYSRANEVGVTPALLRRDQFLFPDIREYEVALSESDVSAIASLVYLFCRWLRQTRAQHAVMVFMGRDAYLLYLAYATLYPDGTVSYGYLNRVTANLFREIGSLREALGFVEAWARPEGIYGIVSQFGLQDTEFSDRLAIVCREYGLALEDLLDARNVSRLVSDSVLCSEFIAARDHQRRAATGYIERLIKRWPQAELVDVGWRGTVFQHLSDSFAKINRCLLLYSVNEAPGVVSPVQEVPDGPRLASWAYQCKELIEWLFREDSGRFSRIGESGVPIFDDLRSGDSRKLLLTHRILADVRRFAKRGKEQTLHHVYEGMHNVLDNLEVVAGKDPIPALDNGEIFSYGHSHLAHDSEYPPQETQALSVQTVIYHFLTLRNRLSSLDDVVLYGAGSGCEFILPHLRREAIQGIVDINPALQGKSVNDIEIKPLDFLDDFSGTVCVTVIGRREQIRSLLASTPARLVFLEDYLQG